MNDTVCEKLPDVIYAYAVGHGTGTWIDFDDSDHVHNDIATEYIRTDIARKLAEALANLGGYSGLMHPTDWRNSEAALNEFNKRGATFGSG